MSNRNGIVDDAFFRQLKQRLRRIYSFIEQNAVLGILLFIVLLILVLVQQIILIVIYPFR